MQDISFPRDQLLFPIYGWSLLTLEEVREPSVDAHFETGSSCMTRGFIPTLFYSIQSGLLLRKENRWSRIRIKFALGLEDGSV
jgi:hypothetical protein